MKRYPQISSQIRKDQRYYAFGKYDGSNIRAEWSKKRGFYKFGTRKRMLDETDPMFGESKLLILDKYTDDITRIMKALRYDRGIFFFEYWSENSFGGFHPDEEHTVTLIDVNIHRKGILPPKEFIGCFGELDIASMLYHGNTNEAFLSSVRNGTLEGMPFEGVVCKAKSRKRTPLPVMFKIKNQAWYKKLRELCGKDEKLYEELK